MSEPSPRVPETPSEIRRVLGERGLRPRKRHGQHFLADPNVRDAIVADAGITPGDLVLEVGPGLGTLTKGLLDAGARVVAAELDLGFAKFLGEVFAGEPRFSLRIGDALAKGHLSPEVRAEVEARLDPDRGWMLVSNLPYSAATPILAGAAADEFRPVKSVAMVQMEVARRITGRPGDGDYGPLAVLFALAGGARILRTLGGRVFVPSVPVQSAVVEFIPGERDPGSVRAGGEVARAAFGYRRKAIRKALELAGRSRNVVESVLDEVGIDPGVRPEEVSPEGFLLMSEAFRRRKSDGSH